MSEELSENVKFNMSDMSEYEFDASKYPIYWGQNANKQFGIVVVVLNTDLERIINVKQAAAPQQSDILEGYSQLDAGLFKDLSGSRIFKIIKTQDQNSTIYKITIHNARDSGFKNTFKDEKRYEPVIDAEIVRLYKGQYKPKTRMMKSTKDVLYIKFKKIKCAGDTRCQVRNEQNNDSYYFEINKYPLQLDGKQFKNEETDDTLSTQCPSDLKLDNNNVTLICVTSFYHNKLNKSEQMEKNEELLKVLEHFKKNTKEGTVMNIMTTITKQGEGEGKSINSMANTALSNIEATVKECPSIKDSNKMIKYYKLRGALIKTLFIAVFIAAMVAGGIYVLGAATGAPLVFKVSAFIFGAGGGGIAGLPSFIPMLVNYDNLSKRRKRTISFKLVDDTSSSNSEKIIKMSLHRENIGTHLYVNDVTVKRIFYEVVNPGKSSSYIKLFVTFEKPDCPFDSDRVKSKRCKQKTSSHGGYKHKRSQKKRNRKLKQKKTYNYGKKSKLRRKVRKRTRKKKF